MKSKQNLYSDRYVTIMRTGKNGVSFYENGAIWSAVPLNLGLTIESARRLIDNVFAAHNTDPDTSYRIVVVNQMTTVQFASESAV